MLTRSNGHRRTGCVFAIYLSAHVETELLLFWPSLLLSQQLNQRHEHRVGAARTHPEALLRPLLRAAPTDHILEAANQPQTRWDQIHASCCLLLRDEQPGGLKRRGGVPAYTAPACGY